MWNTRRANHAGSRCAKHGCCSRLYYDRTNPGSHPNFHTFASNRTAHANTIANQHASAPANIGNISCYFLSYDCVSQQ
jgi:hypothetical protein